LFTVNLFGGAKLFTVGCGEESLRLSLQTMNNFGATIRQRRKRRGRCRRKEKNLTAKNAKSAEKNKRIF